MIWNKPQETTMKAGDLVHYLPEHGDPENGIIKHIPSNRPGFAFVVYKCGGNWEHYQNYTGQGTRLKDLRPGWIEIPKKTAKNGTT